MNHPGDVRRRIRAGQWRRPTTGLCRDYVQANLVILPAADAFDFLLFALRNPQALPLLDVTDPGSPVPRRVAPDADLRTDVPRYRVYRYGRVEEEVDSIVHLWRDDLVGFLLGCSFTAEQALLEGGVRLKHLELGRSVPMYVTGLDCRPAGRFRSSLVVSMRPIPEGQVLQATEVTRRYPMAHGQPIHVGDPAAIGIRDLARPEYGDAVPVEEGEVPVFWACGVTSQQAALASAVPFMIAHAPGHMFVTDLPATEAMKPPPSL